MPVLTSRKFDGITARKLWSMECRDKRNHKENQEDMANTVHIVFIYMAMKMMK